MRVPVTWLKKYVDIDIPLQEVADKLTFSGLQVEEIETVGSDYKGVVVAEVISKEAHKDSDHLNLCMVNTGEEEVKVVCGADNFEVGDKVPFIGVGGVLCDGTKIKKAKIRGEESFGMICAEDELGISDDHSGIMILSSDLEVGIDFSQVMGPPEEVLVLEVTWNRPDCLSVIGVAREVAALCGLELKLPSVDFDSDGDSVENLVKVEIEDEDLCPRYTARVLTGAKPKPSPLWMQKRLTMCGIRPINAIVDVTNYVLLECGQPLHAFDYSLLDNSEIVVRRAKKGEKLVTLDDKERDISPEMLVIADSKKPVALAGVMGGAGSEIRDDTEKVLLESACFSPQSIRATSSKLGMITESSFRFERTVDVLQVEWASARAAALMVEHAEAVVAKGVVDLFPGKTEAKIVKISYKRLRDLLGVEISIAEITGILKSLMLPIVDEDEGGCSVEIPSFRIDLDIDADLIEEIARMYGLDNVPDKLPQSKVVLDMDDSPARAVEKCRANLVGLGLSETMNYSFVSSQLLDVFDANDLDKRVVLPNPVSADHSVMRNSLVPQLVEALGRNMSRQVLKASFFEIGRVFNLDKKKNVCEEDRLSIGLMGPVGRQAVGGRKPVKSDEIFLWLKGIVESLCEVQRIEDLKFTPALHAYYEQGSLAVVINGEECGILGLVKAPICEKWRMVEPVAVAEISLKNMVQNVFNIPKLTELPSYPSITRDVAIKATQSVAHEDVMEVIRKSAPKELTCIELFDIYTSEGMGDKNTSLAYTLTYRSLEKTLTDEDANAYHEKIKESLKAELEIEIR